MIALHSSIQRDQSQRISFVYNNVVYWEMLPKASFSTSERLSRHSLQLNLLQAKNATSKGHVCQSSSDSAVVLYSQTLQRYSLAMQD